MPRKNEFDRMRQQLNGFMRTQIIGATANLSLADHFASAPHSVNDIASMTGLDRGITFRLLRALAPIGLVASDDENVFRSLPPLETLRSTAPGSLRDSAMVFATPARYLPWGYFFQSIKTGLPQATMALGSHIFDYYARHPEEAAIFHKAMQVGTADVTAEIAQRLDTTKSLMAVDVGGATGSLVHSLMEVNPNSHGIVYDRPANVPKSQAAAISLGLSERSTALAGDFFESVPNGDLHLLRFILHDWSDEDCVRILGNCRRHGIGRQVDCRRVFPRPGGSGKRGRHCGHPRGDRRSSYARGRGWKGKIGVRVCGPSPPGRSGDDGDHPASFRIRADGSSGGLLAGFYPSQAASPSEGGLFSGVALGNAAQ